MSAAPILTILRNGETIRSQTIPAEGEVSLGRAEGCVIRIDDRSISRQHAVFKRVSGGVQIERKSEFGPILLNGAECERAVVKEGDVISIGPYLLRLSAGTAGAAAPAQAAVAPAPEPAAPAAPQPVPTAPVAADGAEIAEISVDGGATTQPVAEASTGDALAMDLERAQAAEPSASNGEQAPESDFKIEGAQDSVPSISAGDGAGVELSPSVPVDEDGKTRVTMAADLTVRLVIPPGMANVTEFPLDKDQVTIGRGKDCDIVLNDKKSSRKNSVILRAGFSFVIRDLDSSNGTFVNGVKVKEQELSGEDRIRIGEAEIIFKAENAAYADQAKDFLRVEESAPEGEALPSLELSDSQPAPVSAAMVGLESGAPASVEAPLAMATTGIPGIPGTGVPGAAATGKRKSLFLDKFKAMPKSRQYLIIGLVFLAFKTFIIDMEDDEPEKKKGAAKSAQTAKKGLTAPTGAKAPLTFESLTPEQQRFVEAQHQLAFDHYRNKDYDKALYEIRKIFQLVPDYKDSKEIERYAVEGKRKLEAIEEERRKKEEEAKLKAKIAELEGEIRHRMEKKEYDQARELFGQLLTVDPDNKMVAEWRKEIEAYEEQRRLEAEALAVRTQVNGRAWEVFNEGEALRKKGKYHSAIDVYSKVAEIQAADPKPAIRARAMIAACRKAIAAKRDPLLEQAKAAETAGELSKAFALYKQATRADPPHKAGYAGMDRIRGVLHERAKVFYTEAVLAESYSDFATAKAKYKECLEMAPEGDIYYERAQRKLARYLRTEREEGL